MLRLTYSIAGSSAVLTTVSSTVYSTSTIYIPLGPATDDDEIDCSTPVQSSNAQSQLSSNASTSNLSSGSPVISLLPWTSDPAVASPLSKAVEAISLPSLSASDGQSSTNIAISVPELPFLSSATTSTASIPSTQAPPLPISSQALIGSQAPSSSVSVPYSLPQKHSLASLNPTNSKTWAIAYSPVGANGHCKPSAQIQSDIQSIAAKGFTTIRIYSTECSFLPTILPLTQSLSLRLILGIYIHGTDSESVNDFANQITEAISAVSSNTAKPANPWQAISLIVIANESLNHGILSIDSLVTYINSARKQLNGAGYPGPITTADTINQWQTHGPSLCPVTDFAAANIHPFFDPHTNSSEAGAFVTDSLTFLGGLCPNKEAVNLETGWPHAGECDGEACPGPEEQQVAVSKIREAAGERSVFFSFQDEVWREAGEFGVERNWGLGHLFG